MIRGSTLFNSPKPAPFAAVRTTGRLRWGAEDGRNLDTDATVYASRTEVRQVGCEGGWRHRCGLAQSKVVMQTGDGNTFGVGG